MTCIDCHVERELMGSGTADLYAHDALEVRCVDCHAEPGEAPALDTDRERVAEVLRRSWARRGLPALSSTPLRTSQGTALVRTDTPSRSLLLATTGERRTMPRASDRAWHTMRGHERLSCSSCHTSWAPRCRSCHTSFDPNGSDIDHLSGKTTAGHWSERAGENGFGLPLLALGPRGEIAPFVEGMRWTLEVDATTRERTLYAPLEPHTTSKARACTSCHTGLDATYPTSGEVTRTSARLLDAEERKRIERVGRCLACHGSYDDKIYVSFPASLRRITPSCTSVK
jgi:cytochrome c553